MNRRWSNERSPRYRVASLPGCFDRELLRSRAATSRAKTKRGISGPTGMLSPTEIAIFPRWIDVISASRECVPIEFRNYRRATLTMPSP